MSRLIPPFGRAGHHYVKVKTVNIVIVIFTKTACISNVLASLKRAKMQLRCRCPSVAQLHAAIHIIIIIVPS